MNSICSVTTSVASTTNLSGELASPTAAMVQLTTTEMQARVADACLQLYGGTSEIKKEVIARSLVGHHKS